MFYINTQAKFQPIQDKELLDAVMVPCQERTAHDHQIIYRYFIDNQMLCELERTKSLNARIKCVAALSLVSQADLNENIILHHCLDGRLIVLPLKVKLLAQSFSEKQIRKGMDLLSTYSILKPLRYDQLLYLSSNIEEQTCKYKQYLYRQGELPQYVYFLEEGEFHYVKDSPEEIIAVKGKKNKQKGLSKLKSVDDRDDSPNRSVKTVMKKYHLGIVSGKQGQTIGLEEIVIKEQPEKRKYSVISASTENKLVKIHKKCFEIIFEEHPRFHEKMLDHVQSTNQAKTEFLTKIKSTNFNMKEYLKPSKDTNDIRQSSPNPKDKDSTNVLDASVSMSRYKLPKVQKKSPMSVDHRSRGYSSALSASHQRIESIHFKSLASQINSEYDERQNYDEDGSFSLTGIKQSQSVRPLKTKFSDDSGRDMEGSIPVELPPIGKRQAGNLGLSSKLSPKKDDSTLLQQKSKRKLHIYKDMVDSSKLVLQNRHIFDQKNDKISRQSIFPLGHIEYKQPKRFKLEDPMKLKASPAHSNRFMEIMLLKALKKAGYDEEKDMKEPVSKVKPAQTVKFRRHNQLHKSLSRSRKHQQLKNNEEGLLISSAFDDCYFTKID